MYRKILFALILITSLGITSAFALTARADTLPTWEKVFTVPNFGNYQLIWAVEPFKDKLYIAMADFTEGMTLYRSANGKDWEPANEPGFGFGFEYPVSWDMAVYEGKMYVSVHSQGYYDTLGRIMRSEDGLNWEMVFEVADDPINAHYPAAFGEFKGMIYVAVDAADSSEIWRSPHGDPGTWEKVLTVQSFGFGAPLVSFKGYAYVSGGDGITGQVGVWRSADGVSWERVGTNVVDDPSNFRDGTLAVFKNSLYLSTYNWNGARIYVTKDGLNWETVVVDGFGDPTVLEIAGLIVYKGDLYACGTAYDSMGTPSARVYSSHTGKPGTWEQIPTESWGISGTERMQQSVFKGGLYIANWNLWWDVNYPNALYKMIDH